MKESKRRLTTIKRTADGKYKLMTPLLPSGDREGVEYFCTENFYPGKNWIGVVPYRNDKTHGVWIDYTPYSIEAKTYVDGIEDGLEQWTYHQGTIKLRRFWVNGDIDHNHVWNDDLGTINPTNVIWST